MIRIFLICVFLIYGLCITNLVGAFENKFNLEEPIQRPDKNQSTDFTEMDRTRKDEINLDEFQKNTDEKKFVDPYMIKDPPYNNRIENR